MHTHKVAHCDIKPSNVVVDCKMGRVTLIDFDLAVRGIRWMDGFSGTEGWSAPEVGGTTGYDPFRADVWSAGKVLDEICSNCPESTDREFLLRLSDKMLDTDPTARPSIKNVVRDLDRYLDRRAT